MRKLCLLIPLLLPLQMKAQTIVQTCTDQANSGGAGIASCTRTWGANHTIIMGGAAATNGPNFFINSTGIPFTVVDHNDTNFPAFCSDCVLTIACANTGAGGLSTWSFDLSAFNAGIAIVVYEVAGLVSACTVNGHNNSSGTTSGAATISSGNVTASAASMLVAFSLTVPNNVTGPGAGFTAGPGTFWTWLGNSLTLNSEYQLLVAPGTYAGTFADPGGNSWEVVFGAFGIARKRSNRGQVTRYKYRPKQPKILRAKAGVH